MLWVWCPACAFRGRPKPWRPASKSFSMATAARSGMSMRCAACGWGAWALSSPLRRAGCWGWRWGLVGLGLVVAATPGVLLGLAMGASRTVEALVNPVFLLLRPIPPLAWIPLAIVW